jgi:uncharacterized protein (DUF1697 family)
MNGYVALLRGINVGGNNIIPMRALASTFEAAKLTSVRTYIQSGNVLFETREDDARALEVRLEKAVKRAHGCDIKIVVRSKDELANLIEGVPRAWKQGDREMRYNVVFLRHEIDKKEIVAELKPKLDFEEVTYRPGVLYWSARAADVTRTSMAKLSAHKIYPYVTVRNLNTTKKLFDLLVTDSSSASRGKAPAAAGAAAAKAKPRK